MVALGVRDTPDNPGGADSLGIDWTPWIVLGVAVAAVVAGWLAFLSARRRRPRARMPVPASGLPEAAAPDGLPEDWPQL